MATARGRGRRPGGVDTRAAIIGAARAQFAARGYDKASLRGIARDAGVDPALVHHYFAGKGQLFAESIELSLDPAAVVGQVLRGDPARLGWRVVAAFLEVWDSPERQPILVALLRSGMASEEGARLLREFLAREIFDRIAASSGVADPGLSGSLAAAQLLGLAVLRYVLKVPALVEARSEILVERLGPILQAHLMDSGVAAD